MQAGVTLWAENELFNPSLVCDPEDASLFPYESFIGGRVRAGWVLVSGGWGKAISDDCTTWPVTETPFFEFDGASLWRHWDVMRNGNAYRVYFSEFDGSGKNRIGVGYSDAPEWDSSTISNRVCH